MKAAVWLAIKFGSAAITLLLVSLLIFLAMHLVPGRFEEILLGPLATPELRAAAVERYGLDGSLPEQYLRWLSAVVTGDFGTSLITRQPVLDEFLRRAPVTVQLALMATLISIVVGGSLGVFSATAGRRSAGWSRFLSGLGLSIPDFVIGSVFVFVFSAFPLWLTVGNYAPLAEDPVANLRSMILPALSLSLFGSALIARTTRDAMLAVLAEPYVTAAVARGETTRAIVRKHVVRNAAIPVLTVTTTFVGYLMGGAVIVERLFSLPGFGQYVLTAVSNRDYAIVQAGVLIAAAIFIAINVLVDLAYTAIDPRVTVGRRAA